jgi:hypothetical protein
MVVGEAICVLEKPRVSVGQGRNRRMTFSKNFFKKVIMVMKGTYF